MSAPAAITPTGEQEAILDAYLCGNRLVVDALAGSGKTSTLRMLAAATPRRGGMYIAYNKAIAVDAERSFPSNTLCRTAHSLAFQAVGWTLAHKLRRPRQRAAQVAGILGINKRAILTNAEGSTTAVDRPALARLVLDTISRFCHSAEYGLEPRHVLCPVGLRDYRAELDDTVLGYARAAWVDLCDPEGRLRLDHDHYLKLWHLTGPVLSADVIYLDEAQDANPVIAGIVTAQDHAQLILVGDRHQQLYGWRGATDAMTGFDGTRLVLTKSFRFGPAIAEQANMWLAELRSDLRIVGHDPIPSTVGRIGYDDLSAVLCRTNAGTIAQAIAAEDRGIRAAITGGTGDLAALARAAADLQDRGETSHPEFMGFRSWGEVVEYAQTDGATENLATFVNLVDAYGPRELLRIIDALAGNEDSAQLVVSTGHKAKGREWNNVLIGPDFKPYPRRDPATGELKDPEMTDEARMLAYVAVTRAQLRLDPAGLDWATPVRTPAGHDLAGLLR